MCVCGQPQFRQCHRGVIKLAIQANIVRHRGERHGVTLFQRLDTDWLSDQGHVIQGCQLYPRLLLIGPFSVGRYLTTRAVRVNHLVPTLWLNATELCSLILNHISRCICGHRRQTDRPSRALCYSRSSGCFAYVARQTFILQTTATKQTARKPTHINSPKVSTMFLFVTIRCVLDWR